MKKVEITVMTKKFMEKRPFIIAEMSGNHNQSLERAIKIVEAAKESGADAVKLQTYTADTITIDCRENEFFISDPKNLWKGQSLYELYQKAYTPWEWHEPIFKRCRELGIMCFSTPFDHSSVDFLESLGAPAYKIASAENIDLPLIRKVAATKKPLIISNGSANLAQIDECVRVAREAGCEDLTLLQCTSSYPALPEDANLKTIPNLKELFDCTVGISDHTLGIGVSIAAVALGAEVVERHFTLSRADGGVDSAFSLEPAEMRQLVDEATKAYKAIGKVFYGVKSQESLKGKRSLYIVEDMKAGEILTEKNLRSIRPGGGIEPKFYEMILGKRVNRDIKRGTGVSWDFIG